MNKPRLIMFDELQRVDVIESAGEGRLTRGGCD